MTDKIMLFEDKSQVQVRPASEIFASSVGFEWIKGQLYLIFSTVENRKGYGKQKVLVSELDEVIEVLKIASEDGIHQESAVPTAAEVVQRSLIESDSGEVRFKTESEKGKKPTVFQNMEDFSGFVDKLVQYQSAIHAKATKIKASKG
tara:strand:+ start:305 stop:745 length:441 start_codon:yes stop_codon:yes gene_type:complete